MPFLHRHFSSRRGFTLVELSIVLVIVALLIGGILGGQELMQASRLQAVTKDAQDIREAFHTFKDKYRDWPGDMIDASAYWSGCTDNGAANPCNGDGDGRLWCCAPNQKSERTRAWQHLSLSGIIPGNYTGIVTDPYVPGVNAFAAPFDGFYFQVGWHVTFGRNNNFLDMFGHNPGADYALRAVDAKSIDQKVDDGVAFTGRVFGVRHDLTGTRGCPLWSDTNPADYNVSRSQKECAIRFNWIDYQVDQ